MIAATDTRHRWPRYAAEFRPMAGRLVGIIALSIVQTLSVVPVAVLVKRVFDHTLPDRDTRGLVVMAAELAALAVVNVVMTLVTRHLVLATSKTVIKSLRASLIDALFTSPPSPSERRGRHDLIVHDTERIDVMTNALLVLVLPALAIALGMALWLVVTQPMLFAVVAVAWPFVFLTNRGIGRRLRRHVAAFHEDFQGWSGRVLESLAILDLTRASGADDVEAARHRQPLDRVRLSSARAALWSSAYTVVQNGWSALGSALILIVGGVLVARGRMTTGELVGFWVAAVFLAAQLGVVLSAVPAIVAGDDALRRVMPLLPSVRGGQSGARPGGRAFTGEITFERVSAAYGSHTVFEKLTARLAPQSSTAVLGANGAGKTTLVRLCLGLEAPAQGRLLADGVPYADVDLVDLRRRTGVVLQDAPLIDGSIVENIVYGTNADRPQAIEAARWAGAHGFIDQCADGYDTRVGERGARLSGGQRQLIAVARALCRRPSLLVLDEPTNHLDAVAVGHVLESLRSLPFRPTILVTTHDARVAGRCDHVIRLPVDGTPTDARTNARTNARTDGGMNGSTDMATDTTTGPATDATPDTATP